MRHPIKYMVGTFLGLTLVLSAVPGHAQDGAKVKATIPFNFVVGNKELKAGDYVIESLLANNALQFRSEDGDVQQIAFTVPIETNRTGNHERLLFHHDGDQYFLCLVIGGRKRTRTHSRSSGKGGCEPLKQRPGGCWPVNRYTPNWPGTAGWTELMVQQIPPLVHPVLPVLNNRSDQQSS